MSTLKGRKTLYPHIIFKERQHRKDKKGSSTKKCPDIKRNKFEGVDLKKKKNRKRKDHSPKKKKKEINKSTEKKRKEKSWRKKDYSSQIQTKYMSQKGGR